MFGVLEFPEANSVCVVRYDRLIVFVRQNGGKLSAQGQNVLSKKGQTRLKATSPNKCDLTESLLSSLFIL